MKNCLLLLLVLSLYSACNEDTQSVTNYSKKLVSLVDKITAYQDKINKTGEKDIAKAEVLRMTGVKICDSVIKELIRIGPYNEDKSFQKACIDYVFSKKKIFDNDYKQLINNIRIINETSDENMARAITLQQETKMKAADLDKRDSILHVELDQAHRKFAKTHNFNLK